MAGPRLISRRVYYIALGIILIVGVLLTAAAIPLEGVARDVLINLGSSVIGVFLVAVVLEPIIERGRRPEEQIHPGFPHELFIAGVAKAKRQVRIMGAWPYVMERIWRAEFFESSRQAMRGGAQVQILILDPTSQAALQRLADMRDPGTVYRIVVEILAALDQFKAGLPHTDGGHIQIRVYNTLPPARLYSWDDRAISSFFPAGNRWGSDVRHYETNTASGIGSFVDQQFDLIWTDPRTRDLAEYLRVPIEVLAGNQSFETRYVILDDAIYSVDTGLTDYLMRNAGGDRRVRSAALLRLGPEAIPDGSELLAEGVPDGDPSWPDVIDYYTRKYGDVGEGARTLPGTVRFVRLATT